MKTRSMLWVWVCGFLIVGTTALGAPKGAKPGREEMGLKNFREILRSLATVTQVDASSADIQGYYRKIAGQLPQQGTISEFSPQSWLAAAGLGGVFCKKMVQQDSTGGKPGLDDEVDFNKGPSAVSGTLRTELARRYVQAFLQRPPTATETDELVKVFEAQAAVSDAPEETFNALLAMCVSIAGSIEFLSN